jgi:uncharacterized RDD family membrane protein YckC
MNQKEEKGSSEPKPRYVWDPKKLAWVETTEAEVQEPATERAAVEPKSDEVLEEAEVEARAEEVAGEAAAEGAPVKGVVEAGGLQYRGAGLRLLALIADAIVLVIVLTIVSQVSGVQPITNTASGTAVTSFSSGRQWVFIAILVVYFVGFWAWRGQTPGKMLMGAKIVKTDGRPIGIGRALLRFVVYFLYLLVWGFTGGRPIVLIVIIVVPLIIVALNKRKRGIHDFIAGTVVVNSRPKKAEPVEIEAIDISEAPETAEPSSIGEPETDKQE